MHSPVKGRCVTTRAAIPAGTYVCEYMGDLVTYAEAMEREAEYARTCQGSYMFFFVGRGGKKMWCVRVCSCGCLRMSCL